MEACGRNSREKDVKLFIIFWCHTKHHLNTTWGLNQKNVQLRWSSKKIAGTYKKKKRVLQQKE